MNKKEKSQKMKQVRLSIDLIDSKILPLMVKRSKLVNKALELKFKRDEIIDKKRIDQILKKVGINAKKLDGNPQLLKSIWMSMIQNFINYEKKEFKKRK
jgi:Chorismate mutase|tara:strand:+ start:498 stop:794 length:297 start_codon:yes stop_codon:yes gene_type:complete